jgi:hypothetical protein
LTLASWTSADIGCGGCLVWPLHDRAGQNCSSFFPSVDDAEVVAKECINSLRVAFAQEVLCSQSYARMLIGMSVSSQNEVEGKLQVMF